MKHSLLLLLSLTSFAAHAAEPLIVVEDRGGASALPYYQALDIRTQSGDMALTVQETKIPLLPQRPYNETNMLPVRSTMLTPGSVERRNIQAPGLNPIFLVGEDARSRAWLQRHARTLHELNAVGFVVNVESITALNALRRLAPEIMLSPVAADDLAQRLGIRHYPVLITATGIEQ